MDIIISNKIKLVNTPENLKDVLVDRLRINNPKYTEAALQGYSTYGINQHIYNFSVEADDSLMIPRGYRNELLNLADSMNLRTNITDNTTYFPPNYDIFSAMIKYRPYQSKAVINLTKDTEGILVAPAGSGKTVMGISLVPLLGQPTLWLTHTDRLVKQTLDRVNEFLPSIKDEDKGFIGAGEWDVGKIFTIATIQTLIRNLDELYKIKNDFGLVVLDECHHCPASTFTEVVNRLNPKYLYGLTATPYRRDKLEELMKQVLGNITAQIFPGDVTAYGGMILPTIRLKRFASKTIDTNNIQYILKDLITLNNVRNEFIVKDVIAEAKAGNYCIVVSDRRSHCEILHNMIKDKWKKTGIATGAYSKKHIDLQIDMLYKKEITVLTTTFALLGEGFDVDFLNRAFIAMPFRAEAKAEQLIGRIQRTADGKTDAIVYDYIDINIGVLKSQFKTNSTKECRSRAYARLGAKIEPYS